MPILKPRTRIVYFRVSEDDFQQLVGLCSVHGARSISELARSAMENMIHSRYTSVEGSTVVDKLSELDRSVSQLNQYLKRLIPAVKEEGTISNG